MKTKMIGMNPQFYSHIKSPTKLKHVKHLFDLCMDYIHYCLQSTFYHLDLVKT
jgi:hypothetical protein